MAACKRTRSLKILAALLTALGGCVESRHPFPNETSAAVDERLLGTWEIIGEDGCAPVQIRESKSTKNALVMVDTDTKKDDCDEVFFAKAAGSKGYVSFKYEKEAGEKENVSYAIYQYVLSQHDLLEVREMDSDAIVIAIERKELAGEVAVTKAPLLLRLLAPANARDDKTPAITATSEEIGRYLETHADECFPPKSAPVLTYKRKK